MERRIAEMERTVRADIQSGGTAQSSAGNAEESGAASRANPVQAQEPSAQATAVQLPQDVETPATETPQSAAEAVEDEEQAAELERVADEAAGNGAAK